MNGSRGKLSDEQRAHLQPAVQKIADGFAELGERLADLGWDEGDFSCMRCSCSSFVAPEAGPSLRCARESCGHFFSSHRVF